MARDDHDGAPMPGERTSHLSRPGRVGQRAARALILVVAVLFIGSSAWQLVRALFFGNAGAPPAATAVLDPACADGLRRLASALDRAAASVAAPPSQSAMAQPEDAVALFRRDLSPEWDREGAVKQACATGARGEEAWASLTRLRSAHEQLVRGRHAELAPLRHDLAAQLAPSPRELR
ncbi:MAG: hypothetical protein FWD17_07600 [Polyangiaceae bacterium]|nr:hypothetical protein [Polyangiaceae bacterium]